MTQIHELQHVAHELLYLGADGSPIYTDSFRQLNTEVLQKSDALFALKGENPEEEATTLPGSLDGLQCNNL